ncbi:HNH endonuclease signature motif containing protein [Schumannella sp. 10F1B-5-1]|uniref:HNH endonuclease signature motif containing protein n=1 Tax=Schumannella sp. 10F1B-5-1 TaxID=2590780 RepID=UPI002105F01E|nr:HNH endonuclease signature motif containing protein [Schumannella sp. 10F1B-5-1]
MLADAGRLAVERAAGVSARVRAHDMELRSIAAELGGVLRLSDRTVQARIGDAVEMVERYPRAVEAWEAGLIGRGHMNVIVAAGRAVPEERRAEFEAEALDRCFRDTPNRVRAGLEIYAEHLTQRSLTERHAEAVRERAVRVFPGRDGMCDVVATVPMVIGDAILDRLTRMGQSIQDSARNGSTHALDGDAVSAGAVAGSGAGGVAGAGRDRRGIDQIRADAFADLLLAGTPALDPTRHGDRDGDLGAIRAQVQVVVPALALVGHDESPADLIGCSPIDADTARRLARNAPSLTRMLTDPISGTVIAVDSYRPAWAQRRHLRARDQHCRFPGCRTAAIRCELDHTLDHALGGPTALTNLAHLCQRHHSMKQFTGWSVRQVGGGTLEWTSETGRIYRDDTPAPPVAPVPSTAPPDPPPHRTASPNIRNGDHADLRLPLDPDPEAIDRFFERLEHELGVELARERGRDPAPF